MFLKLPIYYLFTLFFVFPVNLKAQEEDSLRVSKLLKNAREIEQKNQKKSFFYLDKIEKYSTENNYNKGLFIAKKEKAHIFYNQQKYDSSLVELRKIAQLNLKLNYIDQARLYNLKGTVFQAKGIQDSSLHYLNKSLLIYKKTNDSEGIITSLSNIGISLYELGLQKEALQNFEEAYNLCIKLKLNEKLPTVINNYAALLVQNKQPQKAEKLFTSLFINKAFDSIPEQKVTLLLNWASFNKVIEKYDIAEQWYQKALAYSSLKKIKEFPNIYIGLGQVYLQKNKSEKAISVFRKSLLLDPIFSEKKMIYNGISNSYLKLKQLDSVAHYLQKLNTLIEENYKTENKKALTEAQNNLSAFKKDFDIKILTKDNDILTQKNITNNFIILLLLSIGILVFSIIYWYRKQQKLKSNQLVKEMTIKKQGLVTYALKIIQKNQLLYDLKEKVTKETSKDSDTLTILQKEITTAITHSVKNDKDWEQFELFFNDIYKGFYERLKIKSPNLTDNDLRICSLIKLRFTIKEIGNLLFLSAETIKSNRYRIRKKLQLTQKQNLADFLNQI